MTRQTKKTTASKKSVTFTLQQVTEILLKQAGLTEGNYFAHIVPQVRGGVIELNDDEENSNDKMLAQGVIIGLGAIELREVPKEMPLSVDASKLD